MPQLKLYAMKNIIILLSVIALFSCARKEKAEIARLNLQKDSLVVQAQLKEEAINEFVASFNAIEENLKQIKEKEQLITVNAKKGNELNQDAKTRINEDINMIYDMMVKNKQAVNSLSKKLKEANVKIADLEKMVTYLTEQIQAKDAEIEDLKNKLVAMNIQIDNLTTTVDTLTTANNEKKKKIEEQTVTINTAFFALGNKKELLANNIITKEGGFIGLGKTEKLKQDFNKDYFTQIDIRKTKSFIIKAKKAKILTTHPSESYKLYAGEKSADSLVVTDPKLFWSASKYLVILTE